MKRERIKERIKKKFGTMSKFSRLSGYDRTELQIIFSIKRPSPMELAKVSKLIVKTKNDFSEGELTLEILEELNEKMKGRGGVRKFCQDNPEFKEPSMYQILDGKRKNISKKVKELCKVLNIKL